jgi:hypothetical protein
MVNRLYPRIHPREQTVGGAVGGGESLTAVKPAVQLSVMKLRHDAARHSVTFPLIPSA